MNNPEIYPKVKEFEDPPTYEEAINPKPQTERQHVPPVRIIPAAQANVIITQPVVPRVHNPTVVDCPYCHSHGETTIAREPGGLAHLLALLLCIFGCCPLCICPYCIDGCQDTVHRCSNCGRDLAVVNRL